MIDPIHATGWVALGRLGLELLRSAFSLVPRSASDARCPRAPCGSANRPALLDAKLAMDLGYRLCRCRFPPTPMLWDNARHAFVCQNPDCARAEQGG